MGAIQNAEREEANGASTKCGEEVNESTAGTDTRKGGERLV
jgi:hypothetical protein